MRALKLSSQPPKAGVRFPAELAGQLAGAATAALSHDALPDRWIAVLEAAAFSPIRSHVQPTDKPTQVSDELLATVKRLAALLPHIAALFDVQADPKAHSPKPLRPTRPTTAKKAAPRQIPPPPAPPAQAAETVEPAASPEQADTTETAEAEDAGPADSEQSTEAVTVDEQPTEHAAEAEQPAEQAADAEHAPSKRRTPSKR